MNGGRAPRATAATPALSAWPPLAYDDWKDTCTTLHLWIQIVGKLRLACAPWLNHSWHAVLYVTTRGLTTSPIPYDEDAFEIDFDFHDHVLRVSRSDGRRATLELRPRSVAEFYHALMAELQRLGIRVRIHGSPNEVVEAVPFERDELHGSYDPLYAHRFWRVLADGARVLGQFRSEFIGKASPVHVFWGGLDIAATRFSGRPAPPHPGGVPNLPDWVGRDAYSHEVSSAGFWPGAERYPNAIFYSYAYPAPAGFAEAPVEPASAGWDATLSEFVLPYDALRAAASPDQELLAFLRSTYAAAADLGGWERDKLEWPPGAQPQPRRRP